MNNAWFNERRHHQRLNTLMDDDQRLFMMILDQITKTQAVVGAIEHQANAHYAEAKVMLATLHTVVARLDTALVILNEKVLIGNGDSHATQLINHAGRLGTLEGWKKGIQDRFWTIIFAMTVPLLVAAGTVALTFEKIRSIEQTVKALFTVGL